MDTAVVSLIEQMATTTIAFAGSVVTNLWALFLSLAVLAAVAGWIMRKGRVGA